MIPRNERGLCPSKVGNKGNYKSYVTADYYKRYCENVEEDSQLDVTYETYRAIVEDFLKAVMELVMVNGHTFHLPFGLGKVFIQKYKPVAITSAGAKGRFTVDWPETVKLGHYVWLLNEHTSYYRFNFKWEIPVKGFAKVMDNKVYRFVATRRNKRDLAKLIKGGRTSFIS